MKVPQVFKRESKALSIGQDCFHLASNSYGNHMVKRQMRSLLQMPQTPAKPNICSAWPADEGRSQQVDIITSQHLKQLFLLCVPVLMLVWYGRETIAYFSKKKKKRRGQNRGTSTIKKKENSYSENFSPPNFSNFLIGVYSYHETFNNISVCYWTTLIFKSPLMFFLVKFFTIFFFILFLQQHWIR